MPTNSGDTRAFFTNYYAGQHSALAPATSREMELLTPDSALALFYSAENHARSLQSDVWAQGLFSSLQWIRYKSLPEM